MQSLFFMYLNLVLSLIVVYLTKKYLGFRKAVNSIGGLPGYRTLFGITSILSNVIPPPFPGILPEKPRRFVGKHKVYEQFGWDMYAACSAWPEQAILFVADADVAKEITSSRQRFPKPVEMYVSLNFFGPNIIGSEHEEWKRFRKITAPSFSFRNNRLVWEETIRIMTDLFENVWQDQSTIVVDHCAELTLKITLAVIGAAGFGRRISWGDDNVVPPGYTMSYNQALHIVAGGILMKVIIPKWATGLTERMRKSEQAFDDFRRYMTEMIRSRKSSGSTEDCPERHNLFSSLLDANEEEFDQAAKLTEDELLGNIFIFLLAGHETTSHTMCFVFALLALYPKEQGALYEHIKSVLSDDRAPVYEDLTKLTYSWAVLHESLRLYPVIPTVVKVSAEDTTLTTVNSRGEKFTVPVSKGQEILIDTIGIHYNPKYWEDPYEFKPSRFMKSDWNRDAFLTFSAGAHSCLGRNFSETESIAIITMMVLKYKIGIKEEPQFAGETFEQKKERVTRTQLGISLTPVRMPLTFTLRH